MDYFVDYSQTPNWYATATCHALNIWNDIIGIGFPTGRQKRASYQTDG